MKYLRFFFNVYLSVEKTAPNESDMVMRGYSDCNAVTLLGGTPITGRVPIEGSIIVSLPYQTTLEQVCVNWFPSHDFFYRTLTISTSCNQFTVPTLNDVVMGEDAETGFADITDFLQTTQNVTNNVPSALNGDVYEDSLAIAIAPGISTYDRVGGATRMVVNLVFKFDNNDPTIDYIQSLYPDNTEQVSATWGAPIEEWLIDAEAVKYADALPYQNVYALRPYGTTRIFIGDDFVSKIYRGNNEVKTVYMGDRKL